MYRRNQKLWGHWTNKIIRMFRCNFNFHVLSYLYLDFLYWVIFYLDFLYWDIFYLECVCGNPKLVSSMSSQCEGRLCHVFEIYCWFHAFYLCFLEDILELFQLLELWSSCYSVGCAILVQETWSLTVMVKYMSYLYSNHSLWKAWTSYCCLWQVFAGHE